MTARLPSLWRRLTHVEAEERGPLLWATAGFFFILASYYVLRPLRDAVGVAGGVNKLPRLFLGTLLAMLVFNALVGVAVTRLTRRRFLPLLYHFFALDLLGFYVLLRGGTLGGHVLMSRLFFVWASVFNLLAVSLFWGLMADLFRSEQGKRLFALVGLGGTLGAIVGSATTTGLLPVKPVDLLLVSAGLLELGVFCLGRLLKAAPSVGGGAADAAPGGRRTGVVEGLSRVVRSRYLLGITLAMLCYTLTSTFLYFMQARLVAEAGRDDAARTKIFGRIDLLVNVTTAVCQLLVTGRLLEYAGVAATLMVLPAATLGGFLVLGVFPGLLVLALFQVVRRASDYGVSRPAREVLFTVLRREDKYLGKSFIDSFVYRTGDALGAWLFGLVASLGMQRTALVTLPLCGGWLVLAWALGRAQARRANAMTSAGS